MSSEDSAKSLQALYARHSKKKNWAQVQEKLKKHPALQKVLIEVAKRQENATSGNEQNVI
jgi:hypothetical protein